MIAYAIADTASRPEPRFFDRIERLCRAGVDYVQLRARDLDARDVLDIAGRVRELVRPPARFVVNRRVDIALASGADGVHLPGDGLPASAVRAIAPQLVLGRSCHDRADIERADEERVDYILLGPVFPTRSKVSTSLVNASLFDMASRIGPSVIALGGISRENLRDVPRCTGIAAITMFMDDEPLDEVVETVKRA